MNKITKTFIKKIKMIGMVLVLLVASGTSKLVSAEIVGEIMFEPTVQTGASIYIYRLDTTGNGIVDRQMSVSPRNGREINQTLPLYLDKGWKVVFEDEGLKPFEGFGAGRMLAIVSPEGKHIDLTEMFPRNVIRDYLPSLDTKLNRQGR